MKSFRATLQLTESLGSNEWFTTQFSASPTPSPAGVTPNHQGEEYTPMPVHETAKYVRFMARREIGAANDNNIIEDWRFLALVFDR